ncbi:UXT-like protein [Aphelenchoides besseyi]|nr:UXT-like protein [Aphelenchoides besseyi]KAI6210149.1 UXT-like protein [Aphelenchoides besseyi]
MDSRPSTSSAPLTEALKKNAINFMERVEKDLRESEQNYQAITSEIDEYAALKSYILKSLDFAEYQNMEAKGQKVMMDLGKNVYTRATIKPNEKLMIRVQSDLFIQMPYDRALRFVTKRLDLLTKMAEESMEEIGRIKSHLVLVKAVMRPV